MNMPLGAREKLNLARTYVRAQGGFKREAFEQRSRLTSVTFFQDSVAEAKTHVCPVCESLVEHDLPTVEELMSRCGAVAAQLDGSNASSRGLEPSRARAACDALLR